MFLHFTTNAIEHLLNIDSIILQIDINIDSIRSPNPFDQLFYQIFLPSGHL